MELPLSELELEWNCLYRNWNWSGIAFIRIVIELPFGLGTGFGIGVELPLSELELELNCKNGIDPSSVMGTHEKNTGCVCFYVNFYDYHDDDDRPTLRAVCWQGVWTTTLRSLSEPPGAG